MPRMLHLLRHAKSSWDDGSLRDDERPLSARGQQAAARLRVHFTELRLAPEIVLCSPAQRTRQTWEVVRGGLHPEPEVEFRSEIYLATVDDLLALIRGVRPDVASVMIVGHNPGLEDLAGLLVEHSDTALERLGPGFPTGAFASLSLSADWRDVAPGAAELDHLVRPRGLPDTIRVNVTTKGRR